MSGVHVKSDKNPADAVEKKGFPEPSGEWVCSISGPLDQAPEEIELEIPAGFTVGSRMVLDCEGQTHNLSRDGLEFGNLEESLFSIRYLETQEMTESSAKIVFTSYNTAPKDLNEVIITDGEKSIMIPKIEFSVTSVLKQGQEAKPFGPIGPFALPFPAWVVWSVFGGGGLLVLSIVWALLARWRKKSLKEKLRKQVTGYGSYGQFNRDLRELNRKFFSAHSEIDQESAKTYMSDLNQCFRSYLLAEFLIPAHDLGVSPLLRALKKEDKNVFEKIHFPLSRVVRELDKMTNTSTKKISPTDCKQLFENSRRAVNLIQELRQQNKGQKK